MKYLWEILVPTHKTDGTYYGLQHHKAWDAKVLQVTDGMTITKTGRGSWTSEEDGLIQEKMIPVRIYCTKSEIARIAEITGNHYLQDAIMYYRISDYVRIIRFHH